MQMRDRPSLICLGIQLAALYKDTVDDVLILTLRLIMSVKADMIMFSRRYYMPSRGTLQETVSLERPLCYFTAHSSQVVLLPQSQTQPLEVFDVPGLPVINDEVQ